MTSIRALRNVAIVLAALPSLASGQTVADARYTASFSYGVFRYDLTRAGEARMIALRVERPLTRHVIAEGGIAYAHPLLQSGERTHYWIPELQVQVQRPMGILAPYLGIGGGAAWDTRDTQRSFQDTRPTWDPTFSAAGGVRARFTDVVGARAELRVRAIGGEFAGSSTEWTVGLSLAFP